MKHIIPVAAFAALCIFAWWLGGIIPKQAFTLFFGVLLGSFVGIPVMLMLATKLRNQRIDVYHHEAAQKPAEAQKPAQQLLVPGTRYTVLGSRASLPATTYKRLERTR